MSKKINLEKFSWRSYYGRNEQHSPSEWGEILENFEKGVIAAQHRMQLTAFGVGTVAFFAGLIIGWVLFAC